MAEQPQPDQAKPKSVAEAQAARPDQAAIGASAVRPVIWSFWVNQP
jgi:hypothetical protein